MNDLAAQAPQPPKVPPRLRFRNVELAGMAVITLLPVAAMLGFFGPSTGSKRVEAGPISIEAEFPTRLRTAMSDRISVALTNNSGDTAPPLNVSFDARYIEAFSELEFIPEAERPYVIDVADLRPGETRLIEIEVHAEKYGRHEGRISLTGPGTSATLPVHTLIFP